ncbi:MAG: serpin family protein, partial [Verrucomicrobia bacterium]|nr:serpin family protein [Verrucomicrobiota bacterium]
MKHRNTLWRHLAFLILAWPYVTAASGAPGDITALARDNSSFALDLYRSLAATEGNAFFSPYSISTALAMTYAGARGNTEKEMAATLRFSLGQENLHPAFAELEKQLTKVQQGGGVRWMAANSLWPQDGYPFLPKYLELLKKRYGVSVTALDFGRATEEARRRINGWVEEKTQGKIKDLIQPGVLDPLTRLVLVNAIYFKGKWASQFKAADTKEAPF